MPRFAALVAPFLVLACSATGDDQLAAGAGGGAATQATSGPGSASGPAGSGGAGTGGGSASASGSASGGGGTGGMTTTGSGGASASTSASSSGVGGGLPCAAGSVVYTLDANADLYSFDPPTLTFTLIGTLNCPAVFATPFSMAVDRNGTAWVVYTDGALYTVDTATAACAATAFVPGQAGFTTFGMGFSTDMPMGMDETLYVSESNFAGTTIGLGKIDLQTLTLTAIGMYDALNARAELTGTGDAKLFGAFEGSPYIVAELDKTTAQIVSQAPQTAINYPPGSSNFAFAFWGGEFWLFVGPGFSTDVFEYDPVSQMTTLATSVPQVIVGAGVSTCAPLHM